MATTTLTTSGQLITGDFDLHVTGSAPQGQFARLMKADVDVSSAYNVVKELHGRENFFVKNEAAYYKHDNGVPALTIKAVQQ